MPRWVLALPVVVLLVVALVVVIDLRGRDAGESVAWTPEERAQLAGLWIGALGPLPPDPSNAVADDPRAAALGRALFFDTRLSGTGQVACATCHEPDNAFQDGLPLALGIGQTERRTMPLADSARSPWFFWDGRADSQWAQALGPLEHPLEHGGTRTAYAHFIAREYRAEYEAIFGPLPDLADSERFPPIAGPVADPVASAAWEEMRPKDQEAVTRVYSNIGKAIAAYERTIVSTESPFDRWRKGDKRAVSDSAKRGFDAFTGKANCVKCHEGFNFTDNGFHNIGLKSADVGRFAHRKVAAMRGAFKTPTLRDIELTAPYMHNGAYRTLEEVVEHYDRGGDVADNLSPEIKGLQLSAQEKADLVAFMKTLTGKPMRVVIPQLPN
jgi:cytochrome c peroxidase